MNRRDAEGKTDGGKAPITANTRRISRLKKYMNPIRVVLYTRRGCHLCDDALAILRRHGLAPREVDIDTDPALMEKYGLCVPVVEIAGRVRFRGRVDEKALAVRSRSGNDRIDRIDRIWNTSGLPRRSLVAR